MKAYFQSATVNITRQSLWKGISTCSTNMLDLQNFINFSIKKLIDISTALSHMVNVGPHLESKQHIHRVIPAHSHPLCQQISNLPIINDNNGQDLQGGGTIQEKQWEKKFRLALINMPKKINAIRKVIVTDIQLCHCPRT